MNHGSGAHGTGLQCYEKRATGEPVVAQRRGRRAQGNDFSVGGGVQVAEDAILAASDDCSPLHNNCANRHLARLGGKAGFGESELHEINARHSTLSRLRPLQIPQITKIENRDTLPTQEAGEPEIICDDQGIT